MEDHSIVAGLGCHQDLEEGEALDLDEPQATSTVAAKMTRGELNKQYLKSLEDTSEGSSEEFRTMRSTSRSILHCPNSSSKGEQLWCSSSDMDMMMGLPLISTEALSGLSSSKFLVDHTQLRIEHNLDGKPQQQKESSKSSTMPDLAAPPCEKNLLDPSQGVERDLETCDTMKSNDVGLPSTLLEPHRSLLEEVHLGLEGDGTRELCDLLPHLVVGDDEKPIKDVFSNSRLQFNDSQISARSTDYGGSKGALGVSKLLSTSCSSLGSLEGPPDPFLTHPQAVRGPDEDWFEAHQVELALAMEGEEFRALDPQFLEEEEREHKQENRFRMDVAPPSNLDLEISCFSGIHGVTEITVRPSWIGSPERELLGPNNRMLVDDYLQARSEALGTLGDKGDPSARPNFGSEVHSPPTTSGRLQPLMSLSADGESSVSTSYSDTSNGQDTTVTSTLCQSEVSENSSENTVVGESQETTYEANSVRKHSSEESVSADVVREVEELEASVSAVGQPLKAGAISSLLARALATHPPQDLVDRILRLTQDTLTSDSVLEVTAGLDVSAEVMDLRRLREKVVKQPQPSGKENRGKEGVAKPFRSPKRKPLKNVVYSGPELGPCPTLSHKHMKVKAVRTSSDPGTSVETCQSVGESGLEESLQGVLYKSKLLEDTEKLQLPSFSQGGVGVDTSTPCVPRSQATLPEPPKGRPLTSAALSQRNLPRMGLGSSIKGLVRVPGLGKPAVPQGIKGDIKTTSSWASGVSTQPGTTVSANTAHTDIPGSYHAKDDLLLDITGVTLPQHVVLPECVVGIASQTTLPLHNPSKRWLQVSLHLLQETLDGSVPKASALLFEPSHFIEPMNWCKVNVGVCSPTQGQLEAMLEVQIGEMSACGTQRSITQNMRVCATITMPEVDVQYEVLGDCVVAEGCCLSKTVTLTSHTTHTLPLLLHIQQVPVRSPIFCWEESKNEGKMLVSASCMACELPPSTPTTFCLTLKAPVLDGAAVDENGKLHVEGVLKVLLDTPSPTPVTLTSCPLEALIGVVQLEISRTTEPLVLDAVLNQTGTKHLTLKNSSCFPLCLSLFMKDHQQYFSLHPASLTMAPSTCSTLALCYMPGTHLGTLMSVLMVRVEPDGLEFEIAVSGISCAPSLTLTPPLAPAPCPPPPPASSHSSAPDPAFAHAPPQHPIHRQNYHNPLTKASSEPLPQIAAPGTQLNEKNLSSALESTKSRIVFGTVGVGATSRQKLVLRNNWTNYELPLSVTITGSSAFQVCEAGSEVGQDKLQVILNPCQELELSVLLRPETTEPLTATLVCRHRSAHNPYKWKIPLQGYGGQGQLVMEDSRAREPLTLRDLSPGLPSLLQTTVTNAGQRTIFLCFQVFSDKECKELTRDISVKPTQLVVGSGKTREVYIVAKSTSEQLARTPGLIGVLQVIWGDEILRQRYCRLKNKEVKSRRINQPSLLKLNWAEQFTGEQEVHLEPDTLPPQPEDAVVFFNACTISQVEIWGEQRPSEDHSSTVFACLAGEQTMADLTATQGDRPCGTSPTIFGCPSPAQPAQGISWDVLPQILSVQAGDTSPQLVFVVNFTSMERMVQVCSSCRWLEVEPQEFMLPGHSSVRLCVTARPPHTATIPVTQTLKLMGENESRSATITLLPPIEREAATHMTFTHNSQALSFPATRQSSSSTYQPPTSIHQPSSSTLQTPTSTHQPTATSQQLPAVLQQPSATTHHALVATRGSHTHTQAPAHSRMGESVKEKGCLVRLVTGDVTFPDTQATQESYIKVMLRNLDTAVRSVQAKVTDGPFLVRHTQFAIKPGHYVNVPVYFRPHQAGLYTGHLQMTILEDKKVLPIRLSGHALPHL